MHPNDTTSTITDPGYIYILKADDHYKIGKSVSPRQRLATHFASSPFLLDVVAQEHVNDHSRVEHLLHRMFEGKKLKPEWFTLDAADVETALAFLAKHRIDPSKLQQPDKKGIPIAEVAEMFGCRVDTLSKRLAAYPMIETYRLNRAVYVVPPNQWPQAWGEPRKTIATPGLPNTDLLKQVSVQKEQIERLETELRAARRDLRRVEAQRDGLNVALAKLAGMWGEGETDA